MSVEPLRGDVTTLFATRHGSIRPAVAAVVEARGHSVADVLATEGAEDNQYGLPPGLVDRLADRVADIAADRVVVDGLLHSGQMYDLGEALPSVDLSDRRDQYYAHLADDGNEAARLAGDLRARRLERRAAERRQRDGATDGPTGESGAVADLERACDQLASDLEECQTDQRRRVETSYEAVDAHAVIVGPVGAATTAVWAALTEERAEPAVLRPATPETAVSEFGPHEVAVTDTPGLVAGQPEWYTAAVPQTMAAIERADILVVADDDESTLDIDEQTVDAAVLRTRPPTDGERSSWQTGLAAEIQQALPTVRLALTLPYGAESLVSELYDETSVESLEYGEEIEAVVTVPQGETESIARAVRQAGGTVQYPE